MLTMTTTVIYIKEKGKKKKKKLVRSSKKINWTWLVVVHQGPSIKKRNRATQQLTLYYKGFRFGKRASKTLCYEGVISEQIGFDCRTSFMKPKLIRMGKKIYKDHWE